MRFVLNIRATAVEDLKNGIFAVSLNVSPLTATETQLIEKLFPRLHEKAYDLMKQEAILDALVSDSVAITTPPTFAKK